VRPNRGPENDDCLEDYLRRQHGWRCLLTSFEEKVKPRYHRDLRRHFLDSRPQDAGERDIALVDAEIRKGFVFLRRKRNAVLDLERLLNRIEFAVRVCGVKVVAIDPSTRSIIRSPGVRARPTTWAASSCG
jgi:hypothetical protein